jgi:hypothetical protein
MALKHSAARDPLRNATLGVVSEPPAQPIELARDGALGLTLLCPRDRIEDAVKNT